jgi:catechol 2,3-dioxygenase-like lactoylglutathione lyase family enzyme
MIRSLRYFTFAVPDPEVGKAFYTDFGLVGETRGDAAVMHCAGRDQDQIALIDGAKRKRLYNIGFGTRAGEIDDIAKRLEARGVKLLDPPYAEARNGLWFNDPDGVLLNIAVTEDTPARHENELLYNARGHVHRLNERGCVENPYVAKPRRLGHMLLFTPDVPAKVNFYTNALGMKVSDTMGGDFVAFLRNGNGGDHHVIALCKSEKPGFHHASFEFGTVDDIGVATANLAEKGHKHCWGIGRHVVGSNYFHYFRDPWGSLVEHFADMDIIDEHENWQPKDWELEGNFHRWAADRDVPADFLFNADA